MAGVRTSRAVTPPWALAALALLVLVAACALAYRSEEGRMRQAEEDEAARLKSDLVRALDFTFALQSASQGTPQLSASGDTVTFMLANAQGRHEAFCLFVDPDRGLCLVRPGQPAEAVAASIDAFRAAFDRRTDGRPVLWVELSACQAQAGLPPLRQHMYRSLVLEPRTPGGQG